MELQGKRAKVITCLDEGFTVFVVSTIYPCFAWEVRVNILDLCQLLQGCVWVNNSTILYSTFCV